MKVLVWISFVLSLFFSCSGKEAQECGTLQDGDLTTVCRVVGERNRFLLNWPQEGAVRSYKIWSSGEIPSRDPVAWQLKGSVDGKSWAVIDEQQEQVFCSRYQEKLYAVKHPESYNYYMLEVEVSRGDTVVLPEVELYTRNLTVNWEHFAYPEVVFTDEDDTSRGSAYYRQLVQIPEEYIKYHTRKVAEILYFKASDPMPEVRQIDYSLKNFNGVSYKGGEPPVVHIVYSTQHIEKSAEESLFKLDAETRGVLYHELTHAYQQEPKNIGSYGTNKTFWACIEGLADAVRVEAGLFDVKTLRKPGGNWMDGYKTTGFFIQWLTTKDPDAIRKFHQSVRDLETWSFDGAIKYVFGEQQSIDGMWQEYQAFLISEENK